MLVPILLFMYPGETPATITSITLTVAFFNALSGSIAYGRLKRIDYRSGLFFALTAVPGAIIGASVVTLLSRGVFQYVFSAILLLVAVYLMWRPEEKAIFSSVLKRKTVRQITDKDQQVYTYSFNLPIGIFISFFVGILSGLLGIGGGIIHVPAMTQILSFPTHIATATSHFMVAITTFAAADTHIVAGTFSGGWRVVLLAGGAIIGAQFGARLSHRVKGTLIVRLLAAGLAVVALRLLIAPL